MKQLSAKVRKTLENNDFRIIFCSIEEEKNGQYVAELEWYSPAGEDFIVTLWFDGTSADFVREFADYADDFDPETHAVEQYGMRGAPGIRDLLDDADEIKNTLMRVAAELAA